jgi:hypothetical protein
MALINEFFYNVSHNLFKPLLLFFYLGFLVPVLRVSFEFPYVIYQGLTMYLLIAIGWHGGEELASLPGNTLGQALGFMAIGFISNTIMGIVAYFILKNVARLRKVDAATVAGYYGSDSAGTFVTCVGVLTAAGIAYEAYMPVMLAVMEIPGCLVALYLVSRIREKGLDAEGNAWDEPGYQAVSGRTTTRRVSHSMATASTGHGHGSSYESYASETVMENGAGTGESDPEGIDFEAKMALEKIEGEPTDSGHAPKKGFSWELMHEVFLNPGIYLLFGGIAIGFISRRQGEAVTAADDPLFLTLFQGILCLFLLEMGITASKRLVDLKHAGWRFIMFGLLAPNVFATLGITIAHLYAMSIGTQFSLGTYVLFAVLCGAASYIAVPAVQRLAIPEASPTLPLAASLGLTFSYNVTIGIPVYILIAKLVTENFPVA